MDGHGAGEPIAIVGPTASGKSALALAVAEAVDGIEIVAVDAMQVYRRMDIGTAKPSASDRAVRRHHGIDLVEPSETFAVPQYVCEYDRALADIGRRGCRALLVAGTGLYLRAAVDRLQTPGEWLEVRAKLDDELAEDPTALASMYVRLAALDPVAASRIEPANRRRIVRALEVCLGSGRPFSSFGPGLDSYPPSAVVQVGLRWSRPALAERIRGRMQNMIDSGFLDEVRSLSGPGQLSRTASQALGYKELLDHVNGHASLAEAIDTTILRTRQYAVRQERWFRRDPRITWVDVTADPLEAMQIIVQVLAA